MLTSSGDLQIVQLHRTDSGTYVCIADNGVGEPVFREVKLQVNGKCSRSAHRASYEWLLHLCYLKLSFQMFAFLICFLLFLYDTAFLYTNLVLGFAVY